VDDVEGGADRLMAVGRLHTEADLERWLEERIGTLVRQTPRGRVALIKPGAITDADFATAPPDGTIALDDATPALYVRVSGTWKSTGVA
jgi:hypothetical protein